MFIVSLLLSTHRLQRRQAHGDDSPSYSHRQQPPCEVDGLPAPASYGATRKAYRRSHSRDNPSDRRGTRLSSNSHRKDDCVPQVAALQSEAQSASRLQEKLEHCQYHHSTDHVPDCTSSYNNSVPAVLASRTNQLSHHHALSLYQPSKPTSARCWLFQNLLLQSLADLMDLLVIFID